MIKADRNNNLRIQSICLMVLVVVAVTYSIYWLRPVLVPLVVALFVVSGVNPILKTLEKRLGVSRIVAAGLTFLSGVVALVIFGLSIWISLVDLSKNQNAYRQRVKDIVNRFEDQTESFLPFAHPIHSPLQEVTPAGADDASEFVDRFLRDGISIVSLALLNLVSTSLVVLIYVFFLLVGNPNSSGTSATVREIDTQIRSYLGLKTVISIFTGLAFGTALWLFGVPMAFTFGVLAFLLNFVPNVGPIVASLLPVPLIVLDPVGSMAWMIAAISVTCTIQAISGNVVEPKIMGDSSDLHPVTILLALMFWGMMWGVIGMFLATPMTAAMKIMLERIDSTKPIASLMAGRLQQPDEKLATT
ncbi:AI-2E family transporter [Stieleria sp. TO1_6]|uniref:AI-2E family transporter n=1 Tax=Stieleria tagensis TaxID=2956795 RepID=UPI00209B5E43|nr:AI-2E family transporter [Stieleria tagensis]MCO8125253.1 AI-2E family transporter [Stieleria tagensis]